MSCKIATAPINLSSAVNQPCRKQCEFYYNYGNSSCSVINQSTYLDIKCFNGINDINTGMAGSLYVTGVRLYRPSLNTYDGFKADAEIIITHSGGGKNVYVCIPIVSSQKEGSSSKWFSQIIPFSPSEKGGNGKSINVTSFSLNNIIPLAPFSIYDGGTFEWGCNSKDIMIIFNKNKAISMKSKDYRTLVSLIDKHSYIVHATPKYLTFNSIGTSSGPGKLPGGKASKNLTCTPIVDQNGNKIGNDKKDLPWASGPDYTEDKDKAWAKMWMYLGIFVGVIAGLGLIWLIGWAWKRIMSGDTAGGTTNVPGIGKANIFGGKKNTG